jgi:3-oxoacyl-[acyl-carrier protein] reductase
MNRLGYSLKIKNGVNMDLGLKDKVAVVTGGSRGIGKGIALGLAKEGCRLAIIARNEGELLNAVEEIKKSNVEAFGFTGDITKEEDVDQFSKDVLKKFGQVDILVNNVGGNKRNLFENTSLQDWRDIMDINLLSHVKVSHSFLPAMKKQGSGAVIFISSIFGRESGGPTLSIYNSSKSALISLAKVMATELVSEGIRVNSVAPGSIRFPGGSWDKRCIDDPEGMAEFINKELPIGRFGTVEEIANVVCFLASDRASLVTGACINADGGQSHSLI